MIKNYHSKIKMLVSAILAMLLLFSIAPMAFAAEKSEHEKVKTVKLGYFSFQNYMLGAGEGETKSGFAYDLLCDVAAINNWKYEYVYGDFNDLYAQFLKGEIDIIPCLVYTEERAEQHLFSDEEIYAEQYFVSTKNENITGPVSVKDLNGKKISSVEDCYQNVVFEKWAKEQGVSCKLVLTPSFDDSWKQLDEGKADYILNIDSAAQDSGYTSLFFVGSGSSRFAIAPGREDIRTEMNSAINTIYEINPFSISHLKEKYLTETLSSFKLSKEEQEWLEHHNVIKVAAFKDNIPYSYDDGKGNVVGAYPDMMERMFNKLDVDIKVEWKLYNSLDEMHEALACDEVDLVCPDYYGHYFADEGDMIISEKIQDVGMGLLFGRKTKESDIKTIAIPDSKLLEEYVFDIYPKAKIVKFDTTNDCVKAVARNRVDAAIAHISSLQEKSIKYSQIFTIKPLSKECPVCFSANQKDGMLICIVNRGLHLISDSELQSLETQNTPENDYALWTYVKNNKLLVALMAFAIAMIVLFAVNRAVNSRKLTKNLDEITRQKEIIEANEKELVLAREAANTANKAKTTFLFNMSHDIRTPMNAILGYSDRMLRHLDEKTVVEDSASKIKSSGEYLLSLINDVLDMARIESDKAKVDLSINDIKQRAYVLCDVFEVDMNKKDLNFVIDFDDVTDTVLWYDNLKMRQIMLNLISNAVKYTREGGTITHTMRQLGYDKPGYARYEIVVADTGIGMNPEFVAQIFDRFSRSDDSITKETQGTGLGMSIVGKLVDMLGGSIDIQSELGKGTKITLLFDFKVANDEEIAAYEAENDANKDKISIKGANVFLVDDNELNREIAIDILTEEGCTVVDFAENGKIAVDKLSKIRPNSIDIVLMDIQMPVMDGYEATRLIRALDSEISNIPIIAMTANAFEEDRQNALAAGMNDHIAKPIDINKLAHAISKYISV